MEIIEFAGAQAVNLEHTLGRQIHLRTEGRIRPLSIDVRPDRIVVAGTAPSYYLKQLALEAVLDVTRARPPVPVAIRIQVDQPAGAPSGRDLE